MSTLEEVVLQTLVAGVEGAGAHADSSRALDGLDWRLAGKLIEGAPYTVMQSANHIIWWNGYTIALFRGETPAARAVDSWPASRAASDKVAGVRPCHEAAPCGGSGAAKPHARCARRAGARGLCARPASATVGQIALLRRMMGRGARRRRHLVSRGLDRFLTCPQRHSVSQFATEPGPTKETS